MVTTPVSSLKLKKLPLPFKKTIENFANTLQNALFTLWLLLGKQLNNFVILLQNPVISMIRDKNYLFT